MKKLNAKVVDIGRSGDVVHVEYKDQEIVKEAELYYSDHQQKPAIGDEINVIVNPMSTFHPNWPNRLYSVVESA